MYPSKLVFALIIILLSDVVYTQSKDYFQQEVNTVINVRLDDINHRLSGTVYTDYTNNAPNPLDTLFFHLWPNAYKNRSSAFARQQLAQNDTEFYFAHDSLLGGFDQLEFFINGEKTILYNVAEELDIAYILVEQSVKPGETISISILFDLKIPGSFSRFGHEGQSYQITQWFPKPAVYDKNGWHSMPYLNMGEFYSEFGNYDVTITIPSNYYVAATGELLTRSELQRIEKRVQYSKQLKVDPQLADSLSQPGPDPAYKSIRFIADNVHDFAWFADKRFLIDQKDIELENGSIVKGQVFYLPSKFNTWENALEYVERGLRFYSEKIGTYPYPKVAAVQGSLKAGGGMEYPMLTVISEIGDDQMLDRVIIHEIGHNWFYGILANNERYHPWLDEGLNSYYDFRYSKEYHKRSEQVSNLPAFIYNLVEKNWYSLYHDMTNRRALSQPSDLHSTDYTLYNYFLAAYQNPTMAFNYLGEYLGTERFDEIMAGFYTKFAFKHFDPKDLRQHFLEQTREDLNWFFEGMIGDTRVFDYDIRKVRMNEKGYVLKIENNTKYKIPFQLTALRNGEEYKTIWIDGFTGDSLIVFQEDTVDQFVVDYHQLYSDNNRSENSSYTKWYKFLPIRNKPKLQFFNIFDDPLRNELGWLPSVGWNKANGIMVGLMLYNSELPNNNFEYFLHPMISTGLHENNRFVGQGRLSYNWFRKAPLRRISASISGKSFHYDLPNYRGLRYIQMKTDIGLRFNHSLTDKRFTDLNIAFTGISNEKYGFPISDETYGNAINVKLRHYDQNLFFPMNWEIGIELGDFESNFYTENHRYAKVCGSFSTSFLYSSKKTIDLRIFGGTYLWQQRPKSTNLRPGTFSLIGYAANDYLYEDNFLDRGTQDGLWSHQLNMTGGGFKTVVGTAYNIGYSNKYIAALNFKADLPIDIPVLKNLKPFLDAGLYGYLPSLDKDYQPKFLYSGGIMFETYEGLLNIYFPLINSKNIEDIYSENGNYLNRLSFSMNLKLFDFSRLIHSEDLLYGQ